MESAPGGSGRASSRRRLHQGHGDGRAIGRARGSRAGPVDPRGACGARRRGSPPRPARRRARGGPRGARLAIEEGVDTIEHGLSLHREPALLERMAASGQVLVPTLSTFHDLAERFADQWVPRLVEQAQRQLEEAYLTLQAAQAAGVTLAMGFDSGPPGSEPWELVRMAEGGLGPLAALRAATAGGAAALGARDLGRLARGAPADLIVVDGDPLADPRVLLRPGRLHLVLRGGVPIAGRELDPAPFNGQALPPDGAEIPEPRGQPSCCMPAGKCGPPPGHRHLCEGCDIWKTGAAEESGNARCVSRSSGRRSGCSPSVLLPTRTLASQYPRRRWQSDRGVGAAVYRRSPVRRERSCVTTEPAVRVAEGDGDEERHGFTPRNANRA